MGNAINQNTMSDQKISTLFRENPMLIRLIGLSPLLAISYSLTLSLSMGIIFFIVLMITTLIVSSTRFLVPPPVVLACYVLISATLVTIIDLLLQVSFPGLRSALGIYLPIVAMNCLIIDRTLVFASQNKIFDTLKDAAYHGLAVMLLLVLLGSFRELIAYGSLLKDLDLITGESNKTFSLQLIHDNKGFILAALPAGAFISIGLLIALGNYLKSIPPRNNDHKT